MRKTIAWLGLVACLGAPRFAIAAPPIPVIVLVHGAFADASSWNGVIAILEKDGYRVVAAANPLRGVAADARSLADLVSGIDAPVVLVGHSYGGSVISAAGVGRPRVRALVYVSAFAPEAGETAAGLSGRFPGSTLASTLASPVRTTDGATDLYIRQDRFAEQFAADVPKAQARLMAATQRPIAEAALTEPSGPPSWRDLPSWFVYGGRDRNIPVRALAFMAERAHAKETVVVASGSHVMMVSHPLTVATVIEHAAEAVR